MCRAELNGREEICYTIIRNTFISSYTVIDVVDVIRVLKQFDSLDLNEGDVGKRENNLYLVEQCKIARSTPQEIGSNLLRRNGDTSHIDKVSTN